MRQCLLILIVVALLASLAPASQDLESPLPVNFIETSRVEALAQVCERLGLDCILAGEVEGQITLEEQSLSAAQVLDALAGFDQCWTRVGGTILIVPAVEVEPYCAYGGDFYLEQAPREEMLRVLRREFPLLPFRIRGSDTRTFHVSGTKDDLLAVKSLLVDLDKASIPGVSATQEVYKPDHLNANRARQILARQGLEVQLDVVADEWRLRGTPGQLRTARYLFTREDLPDDAFHTIQVRQVQPSGGCVIWKRFAVISEVGCDAGCQGPLHRFGLRPGDRFAPQEWRAAQAFSEWRIEREGKPQFLRFSF